MKSVGFSNIVNSSEVRDGIVWKDATFPATRLRQGASLKPDFDTTNIGLLFPQNDATEIVYINHQLNHDYKLGSNIRPPRSEESRLSAFFHCSGWFFFQGTIYPVSSALFTCI